MLARLRTNFFFRLNLTSIGVGEILACAMNGVPVAEIYLAVQLFQPVPVGQNGVNL
jgi:hypothetical protein